MRKLLFLILMIVPMLFVVSCGNVKNDYRFISEVHDGDTFTTSYGEKIRLFGVDTPEISNQYNGFNSTEGLEQIYALQAKEEAQKLLLYNRVEIKSYGNDKYGRLIAKINIFGKDLAEYLIEKGLARIAYFNVVKESDIYFSREYEYFEKLSWKQYQAFENHIGVWNDPNQFKTIFPKG